MPKIRCDKHGQLFAPHACHHLSEKTWAQEVHGNATLVDFDDLLFTGYLCDGCLRLDDVEYYRHNELTKEELTSARFEKLMDHIDWQPVCPKCFEELRTIKKDPEPTAGSST